MDGVLMRLGKKGVSRIAGVLEMGCMRKTLQWGAFLGGEDWWT